MHEHPLSRLLIVILGIALCGFSFAPVCAGELPAAPDRTFSVVVIPDTQHYRKLKPDDPVWENAVFDSYSRWTAANIERQRIVFVSHVGDIVNVNEKSQWNVARKCMDRFHGRIPYGISVGNHDMVRSGDSSLFQEFFPQSRFAEFDWYGGSFAGAPNNVAVSGNNANSFQLFSAEGLHFVILHLECNAPDNVLDWANAVLTKHADRRAIVTTHMGLGPRDKPRVAGDYFDAPKGRMTWKKCHGERGNSPQQMWDKCFRRHSNLLMICCGDQSRTQAMRQASRGDHGNVVHELLSDYGASGLRVIRFVPTDNRIEVRTWNPITSELTQETKIVSEAAEHQFDLSYSMTGNESAQLSFEVIRELSIPTKENQQGIGTDGHHLYVQTRNQLLKYDLDGKPVAEGKLSKLHHGGITVANGNVYCAVSECVKEGTEEHWVRVYDADTLELVASHDVAKHFSVCAGGIAHHDGHFFVAESFYDNEHSDRIVEFDAAFKHVRTHETNFKSPYGIQGLEYLPSSDQFHIQSHGLEFYRINSKFESDSLQTGRAVFKLQDVARLNNDVLIINSRKAQKVVFVRINRR